MSRRALKYLSSPKGASKVVGVSQKKYSAAPDIDVVALTSSRIA